MKKIFIITTLFFINFIFINNLYANVDDFCKNEKNQYENLSKMEEQARNKWTSDTYGTEEYNTDYNTYKNYSQQYVIASSNYKVCIEKYNMAVYMSKKIFFEGVDFEESGNYTEAIKRYQVYLLTNPDKEDSTYYLSLLSLCTLYYQTNSLDNSLKYCNLAIENTSDNSSKENITNLIKNIYLKKESVTNDKLVYLQYYLKQLNIPNAWNKVKNNNQVIVAVIDDGININHPDLVNSIWTNPKAKYGESKIIDFVGDGMPANLPVGEHGTMIAGIIGATQNNNEGIAGISKNVKLMPLRVFNANGGATEESIINAMNYAIDNGANIINLSLGLNQFSYSDKFDTVIKKAFDSGVVVVIAAGNGDILSGKNTGINLTNNPISPVCNNESKYKYSIGVYAIDENGYRTNWTNYGNCSDFFAPGVGIVSTSIPYYNSNYGDNYNIADGTSFSAPIITGIIALGYNQYGYINPVDVYDALNESYVSYKLPGGENGKMLDVSKYIDILGEKVKKQQDNQKIIDNQNKQKQKAEVAFNQIKNNYLNYQKLKEKILIILF